jgi:hypothetical protein
MIVAAVTAADVHAPSQTRALKLSAFKCHLVKILNQMQKEVHNYVDGEEIPKVTFLFGGYDWWKKVFRIWKIAFSEFDGKFIAHERTGSNGFGSLGKIEFAGDEPWTDKFKETLKGICQSSYGLDMKVPPTARFDLEPFVAIRELLSKVTKDDTIGGSPQAVKIYQFMNSADVGVFWPNAQTGRLFISGRPLLEYERATIKSVLDPATLNSTWSTGDTEHARHRISQANVAKSKKGEKFAPPAY